MQTVFEHKAFGGTQGIYRHASAATGLWMDVGVFAPAGPGPYPVLTFLGGLGDSWREATEKAGLQRLAAEHKLIVITPDTGPRDTGIDSDDPALGEGASFYVDATQDPWAGSFRMFSYITQDLPALAMTHFNANPQAHGITGFSMGGHGALIAALTFPEFYTSLSALAPIAMPSEHLEAERAFTNYLGVLRDSWAGYDATRLIASETCTWHKPILIDQGAEDALKDQLGTHAFVEAASQAGVPVTFREQPGYDHSWYFVASHMADHVAHHAAALHGR